MLTTFFERISKKILLTSVRRSSCSTTTEPTKPMPPVMKTSVCESNVLRIEGIEGESWVGMEEEEEEAEGAEGAEAAEGAENAEDGRANEEGANDTEEEEEAMTREGEETAAVVAPARVRGGCWWWC